MFDKSATRTVVVLNAAGLHARPSLAIVKAMGGFQCEVEIRTPRQVANARNIMEIMSLGARCGTEVVLSATGPDAEEAIQVLADLFANRFGQTAV